MSTTEQRLKMTQSSSTGLSDYRPAIVPCSSKDEHNLLSQNICTLCRQPGKADEGSLIACAQCGHRFHTYCVNIKGLKVAMSKSWKCLECTVCETCGLPGDEAKLLLCDECEYSCHTYCLDPPLKEVPSGSWKCLWCVVCQRCGSNSPGINSDWQNNYTECGPCSSQRVCAKCKTEYNLFDLIIQCLNCSRWLHSHCDSIRNDDECELASELGYTCILCRPKDEIPLYLAHRKSIDTTCLNDQRRNSAATSTGHDTNGDRKPSFNSASNCNNDANNKNASESNDIKSDFPRPQSAPLTSDSPNNLESIPKRPASSLHFTMDDSKANLLDNNNFNNPDCSNEATNDESAINKSKASDEQYPGPPMVDGVCLSEIGFNFMKSQKLEPAKRQRAKRGTKVQKLDDCNMDESNRDDFIENKSLGDDKADDEVRKKRIRKLSKIGIGGFAVRQRGVRVNKEDDFNYSLSNETTDITTPPPQVTTPTTLAASVDQASENAMPGGVGPKPKRIRKKPRKKTNLSDQYPSYLQEAFFGDKLLNNKELSLTEDKYSETLNDCINNDLRLENGDTSKSALNSDSTRQSSNLINDHTSQNNKLHESVDDVIGEFSDIGKHGDPTILSHEPIDIYFNEVPAQPVEQNEFMPERQESLDVMLSKQSSYKTDDVKREHMMTDHNLMKPAPFDHGLSKKDTLDPLLNPEFSLDMVAELDSKAVEDVFGELNEPASSQKIIQAQQPDDAKKIVQQYELEEALGNMATKSAVLFANIEHPNLKNEYKAPDERYKQIQKLWRNLPPERRKVYVDDARKNRSASKVVSKSTGECGSSSKKVGLQQIQPPATPRMQHDTVLSSPQPQQGPMTPSPMSHHSQDTRWRQPMPIETHHQPSRFLPSPQQQPLYNPVHHQPQQSIQVQNSPGFVDGHQHPQPVQQPQQVVVQQSQFSPQRLPQYMNQQRMVAPNQQQFGPGPHMVRMSQNQMRIQHSPHQQPQVPSQMNYQSHRPSAPRFHAQQHVHEVNQPQQHPPQPSNMMNQQIAPNQMQRPTPPQLQPQQIGSPQLQMASMQPQQVASPQLAMGSMQPQQISSPQLQNSSMQQPHQFHQQSNYNENQAHLSQQQSMHGGGMNQSSQYSQAAQQQQPSVPQVMYGNNNQPMQQMNPRRQFPPQHPQQQQHMSPMPQPQQSHYVQQQARMPQVQPLIQPQQQPQVIYGSGNNVGNSHNLPPLPNLVDDAAQILDDDDDLKDLGADFNILEYADPEPEKGASTSAGKSNIELDAADLEEYFVDRDALEEKRANDPLLPMTSLQPPNQQQAQSAMPHHQQQPQQQQQVVYNHVQHMPQQQNVQVQAQQGQSFTDHQPIQHPNMQQQQQSMQIQPNQYSPQRQGQYVNQSQRAVGMNTPQAFTNQQQPMLRGSQVCQPMRMQHPQQQQQQPANQMNYRPRFISQDHTQEMHGHPQHMQQQQQQPMMSPQQVGSPQLRPQARPHKVSPPQIQRPQIRPQQVGSPQMQRPQMQPQQVGSPQLQMSTMQPIQQMNSPQMHMQHMQPSHQQYHQPQNFMDNHQGQQMHSNHTQHQPQYHPQQQQHHHIQPPQMAQQQNSMYPNHQHPQQMAPRRQFQPQQHQQSQYGYQSQHQNNYQMINMPPQQQQVMGHGPDMAMHEKSPIVGEAVTSMQFTMYEQGSGAQNEAVNPMIHTNESQNNSCTSQERALDSGEVNENNSQESPQPNFAQGRVIPGSGQPSPLANNATASQEHSSELRASVPIQTNTTSTAEYSQPLVNEVDSSFKSTTLTTVISQSGRISSCSMNKPDSPCLPSSSSTDKPSGSSGGSSGNQPQNQLLKQLLGNCSSADSPNQDSGASLSDSSNKTATQPVVPPMTPKQYGSGIPTLSFQKDPAAAKSNNPVTPVVTTQQPIVGPKQIKGPVMANQPFAQPPLRSPGAATIAPTPTTACEIKTYNVGPQDQPTVSINIQPIPVRVVAPTNNQGPIVHIRPDHSQTFHSGGHGRATVQQMNDQRPVFHLASPVTATSMPGKDPKINQNGNDGVTQSMSNAPAIAVNPPKPTEMIMKATKSSAAKRKNDYMAKRRADLEKEPTPPPREIKPKKRVRGPNKRSRVDGSDEIRTIDSNSNTSETSQLPDGSQSAPARKRARKSQSARADTDSNESTIANLVSGLNRELPKMPIREPEIRPNVSYGALFACGDLNSRVSKLRGHFGKAEPVPEFSLQVVKKGRRKTVGFYHEEFPEDLEDVRLEVYRKMVHTDGIERDCDSPDSIISASSDDYGDELSNQDFSAKYQDVDEKFLNYDLDKFLSRRVDLHKLSQNSEQSSTDAAQSMDLNNNTRSISPSIPVNIKLPTTKKSLSDLQALSNLDVEDNNKENLLKPIPEEQAIVIEQSEIPQQPRQHDHSNTNHSNTSLNMRLKDHGNVSVTLTLTNKEADGVKRVLNSLSQLLGHQIQQLNESSVGTSVASTDHDHYHSQQHQTRAVDESGLSNSFRLLTGSNDQLPNNQTKGLKFNEQSFVSVDMGENILGEASNETEPIDVKPEFCCRCKAVVLDRGIRKGINEIPASLLDSMIKLPLVRRNQDDDFVFCSVNCYTDSIKSMDTKRRWANVRYTRWTPTHFEIHKPTSPVMRCARTEPYTYMRTLFKRPYTIHNTAGGISKSRLQPFGNGDSASSPYIKQFVHSKSSQYRKMKSEWRNNVVLKRSRVQGLGLYAARDIEKHTMIIEYIGILIRNEIAERYERIHEAHNRGIYMFRLDDDRVIDATLAGGLARYINHSCNPNCVAEAVEIDRERKILIIANRKIHKGEELSYDYKLAIEDDQHKISCLCGAPACKKYMN